jgi:glycosyltransferase involved in cell wall biosynthesis
VWDQYDAYFGAGRASLLTRAAMSLFAGRLRAWDVRTAPRVTRFVANSQHVRERIRRYYHRDSDVVYPPVDIARFAPAAQRDDSYVVLAALVAYKRVDLAIEAFNRLGRRLLVIGAGPEYPRLRALARSNIEFTGRISDDEVAALLGRARGMIMPMVEDFGISAVEAQAAGTPVLAYARGGALETVVAGVDSENGRQPARATGVLFEQRTAQAIVTAVQQRERLHFDTAVLRAHAARFGRAAFHDGIRVSVHALLDSPSRQPQPAGR